MNDKLLKDADESGLYHLPTARRSSVVKAASKLKLTVLVADIATCKTAANAFQELGNALHFPIWFGANFDALYDCLTDPDWQPGKGHVVLIDGIEHLRQAEPEDFATLIEVFQAASEARRATGSPFWILLDTPARGVAALPEA